MNSDNNNNYNNEQHQQHSQQRTIIATTMIDYSTAMKTQTTIPMTTTSTLPAILINDNHDKDNKNDNNK